jgi:riboflavin kinase / FMN adenylyltransferase
MRILRHTRAPAELAGAVLALGNFDGVHRGHRAVIGRAREVAQRLGAPLGVLTFEPHPRSLFQPNAPPFRLTPFRSKAHLLAGLGLDLLVVTRFDRKMSQMLAQDFVMQVLVEGLKVRHLVVGYDFVFGAKRGGTPQVLDQMSDMEGYGLTVVEPVAEGSDIFSSTLIRTHLTEGRPRAAAELLGHWWEIEGHVRQGFRRGRTIGFPTANLTLGDYLRPAFGVYAVRAWLADENRWVGGAANLGRRPTVAGETENLEVHLFDYQGDLYGKPLRVQLVEHIRPERKFSGLDELKAQIARDSEAARELLQRPWNALERFV